MTIAQLRLALRSRAPIPTTDVHRTNGTTSLIWHVDNNDDRYVLVADSTMSEDFFLLMRDNRTIDATVKDDIEETVKWIVQHIHKIKSTSKTAI